MDTKKNVSYHTVIQRSNGIKLAILLVFLAVCSWPRVFIETFTRRSFGERYFLFSMNLSLTAMLTAYPIIHAAYGVSFWAVIGANFSWYLYLALFLLFTFKRNKEVQREPGVFDFAKYSLSTGYLHPWFYTLNIKGVPLTKRQIAIYVEPGIALLVGLTLILFKQNIGILLTVCSIVYSLSWAAQYHLGDHFIMDKIDKIIANEETVASFVDNRMPHETRGYEVHGHSPNNINFRRKVAENMIEEEPAVDVI